MKSIQINQHIREHLKNSQFTTDADIDRVLRLGKIATCAQGFLEMISQVTTAECVFIVNEFYRNFLGMYDEVAMDTYQDLDMRMYRLRFFNQISPNGQDGVQLEVRSAINGSTKISLVRLTTIFDITSFTIIKEYN